MVDEREAILVVDDDSQVLLALEAELSEYYDVTPMMGAEQALASLQCRDYAAIVSEARPAE